METTMSAPPATAVIRTRPAGILGTRRRIGGRLARLDRRLGPAALAAVASATSAGAGAAVGTLVVGGVVVLSALALSLALAGKGRAETTPTLLLFVLALLKGELVLCVEPRAARCVVGRAPLRCWVAGLAFLPLSLLLLLLLHHLHLLHLLHHSRVHPSGRATRAGALPALHLLHGHHLLHHCRVHAARHCHSVLRRHLGLHHCKVLLHALPVLRHHLRAHAVGHAAGALLALRVAVVVVLVVALEAVILAAASAELAAAAAVVVVAHVAARLGLFDFNGLAEDLEWLGEGGLDGCLALEGDEAEAARAASILVHHERGVNDAAELGEELFKISLRGFLGDAADEDLAGFLLLITWNGTFGVNLAGLAALISSI